MRRTVSMLICLALLAVLPACKKQLAPEVPQILPAHAVIGDSYYTQFTLHYEKGRFRTTNYRKGTLLPVNSRVTLLSVGPKTITVQLDASGQELLVENVEKFSGDDLSGAFDKIFRKQPLNLKPFSRLEKDNITAGTVSKGMHKPAVLAAIGYPPQHQTPSLDSSEWTYWSNRFDKFAVLFQNGVVTAVRD